MTFSSFLVVVPKGYPWRLAILYISQHRGLLGQNHFHSKYYSKNLFKPFLNRFLMGGLPS
jgi:hypothetical protein